jgi:hypothetical protein
MPSAATTSQATEQLAHLMAAVEQAKRNVAEREAELAGRRRELASLLAEEEDYQRRVGAGAKRDQALERRVAKGLAAPGVERRSEADGGGLTDRLAEARADGAREALERAEEELRAHCRDHLEAIAAELTQGEPAEREQVLEAARELARRMTPLRRRWRRLHSIFVLAGRPGEAPPEPFASAARALSLMERS